MISIPNHKFVLLLGATAALALGGCQTTGGNKMTWNSWTPISLEQSAFSVALPPDMDRDSIKIKSRSSSRSISQEMWSWKNGQAHGTILPSTMYMNAPTHSSDALLEEYKTWRKLKKIDLKVGQNSVQRKSNRLGNYFYAVSDESTSGETCFVFYQGILHHRAAGYQAAPPNTSGGSISGYSCVNSKDVTAQELSEKMLSALDTLRRR